MKQKNITISKVTAFFSLRPAAAARAPALLLLRLLVLLLAATFLVALVATFKGQAGTIFGLDRVQDFQHRASDFMKGSWKQGLTPSPPSGTGSSSPEAGGGVTFKPKRFPERDHKSRGGDVPNSDHRTDPSRDAKDQHQLPGMRSHGDGEAQHTFIPAEPDTSPLGQPPHIPERFLIEEADYCRQRPNIQVISYVHSAITRVKLRKETRTTWGNASAYDLGPMSVNIGVVFMVGRAKNDEEQRIVEEESKRYHDIVQGDYGDHYRLLTYKCLAGLYWINKHCAHVPWTLHSDDDTHLDIFQYHRALQGLSVKSRKAFVCRIMKGRVPRFGRWKMSYAEYPEKRYPRYCSGAAWFIQTKFIPHLLKAARSVPYLWVDDVYITGLLARKANITHLSYGKYYGGPRVKHKQLGKEMVWFEKNTPRWTWWQEIVRYHREHNLQVI